MPQPKDDLSRSLVALEQDKTLIAVVELSLTTWLGPVDKPVLAPAQTKRLGRCNTDVATGVTHRSADPTGKQRIKGRQGGFQKES